MTWRIGGRRSRARAGGRSAASLSSSTFRAERSYGWSTLHLAHDAKAPARSSERRPRSGLGRKFLLLAAGMGGLGAAAFLATAAAELAAESQLFDVQGIKIAGNTYVSKESIAAHLGDLSGQSLWAVDPTELAARLSRHPRLRSAHVRRGLDRQLAVEVEERRPVALLSAGALVEVDAEGYVLPPVERGALPDLPILAGVTSRLPSPGTRLKSPGLEAALGILAGLSGEDPEFLSMISQIDLAASPICRIHLVDRPQVIVAHAGALTPAKLAGLRSVLDDLDRRGRLQVEVDLRFEGQLVVRDLAAGT
jgi:POTRA domain, FtsQ-type